MYLKYKDVKVLHLEFTSLCNARCPQCARTDNLSLPMESLTLEKIKNMIPVEFIKNLDSMYSCGNYGDPIVNPECLDICQYFIDNGCSNVSLHSNGGVRDTEFWHSLGNLGVRVVFAIDGLEDTNHIYRVGVNWNKLMHNVKTFISAGGYAEWAFLLFEHNEHQVEQAELMSKELGFKKFKSKASSRFVGKKEKVINKKQQEIKQSIASQKHVKDMKSAIEKYGSWDSYLEQTPIRCKTKEEKSLYIDFQGKVWPCCWMGYRFASYKTSEDIITSRYGNNTNSLKEFTLEEILDNKWLGEDLVKSWQVGKERIPICPTTCGEMYTPVEHSSNKND